MRAVLTAVLVMSFVGAAVAEEMELGAEWVPLFNGKDLSGWRKEGEAVWTVENGAIIGTQGEGYKGGNLLTEKEFDNFELLVTFKVKWPANSGVWFRYRPGILGYQVDILELAKYGCTVGSIYTKGGFISKFTDESIVRKDDWNTIWVRADGTYIEVKVNDVETAVFEDTRYSVGAIGFQVHGGKQFEDMKIIIKEAKIKGP